MFIRITSKFYVGVGVPGVEMLPSFKGDIPEARKEEVLVCTNDNLDQTLNNMAKRGWELVKIDLRDDQNQHPVFLCTFQRKGDDPGQMEYLVDRFEVNPETMPIEEAQKRLSFNHLARHYQGFWRKIFELSYVPDGVLFLIYTRKITDDGKYIIPYA